MHLWDKGGAARESLISFTCDRDRIYDARLAPYDIAGSMAHAVMLEKCGLITAGEKESLLAGLARLFEESVQGDFCIGKEYEDIHSLVEFRLHDYCRGGRRESSIPAAHGTTRCLRICTCISGTSRTCWPGR
ncbi:MAG: hypothetical protein MZV63_51680 [Marinilabiliales bacterium]|nr:hypothetical protein [Marinilabiliales bacterium]